VKSSAAASREPWRARTTSSPSPSVRILTGSPPSTVLRRRLPVASAMRA